MEEIDRLLENWGRWARNGSVKSPVSPTWLVMRTLQMYGTAEVEEPECGARPSKPVDEEEAMMVNASLQKLPCVLFEDRVGKQLLMEIYLKPWMPFSRLCQQQHVSRWKGEEYASNAKRRLAFIIDADLEVKNRLLGK